MRTHTQNEVCTHKMKGMYTQKGQVCTHSGILSQPCKKEGNSDTCSEMDESWRHYTKWNKPVTKGQIQYDSIYTSYLGVSNS